LASLSSRPLMPRTSRWQFLHMCKAYMHLHHLMKCTVTSTQVHNDI
jgi:hypothetical protein